MYVQIVPVAITYIPVNALQHAPRQLLPPLSTVSKNVKLVHQIAFHVQVQVYVPIAPVVTTSIPVNALQPVQPQLMLPQLII